GNLGRSQVATQELPNLCFTAIPDVYLLQKPYIVKGDTFGLRLGWRTIMAKSAKVLVTVRNPTINILIRHVGEHVVALDLMAGRDRLTVVNFYFPPSLPQTRLVNELKGVLDSISSSNILIAGDANVRSSLWGPEIGDHRPHDEGGPFIDMILARRLFIRNDPASLPTFETERAAGLMSPCDRNRYTIAWGIRCIELRLAITIP
ncbi:hypothetical protein AVEN_213952-1, partial [Araneus ventricosus]